MRKDRRPFRKANNTPNRKANVVRFWRSDETGRLARTSIGCVVIGNKGPLTVELILGGREGWFLVLEWALVSTSSREIRNVAGSCERGVVALVPGAVVGVELDGVDRW